MSITWGDLRSWRSAGVTSASDLLRADITALEKARDAVESDAVPASFDGFARIAAVARQSVVISQMKTHIEGLTAFERIVYAQVATVTSIERAVQDVDTDASAQQFSIDSAGTVSDIAPTQTFDNTFERNESQDGRRSQPNALVARMTATLDDACGVDSGIIGARPHGSFSDDFEIRIEDLEDEDGDGVDDDPDTDVRGSWSEDDRVLRIDEGNLDDPTILGTVAHEVRHAQQHTAIDDLPWWPWEAHHGPPRVGQDDVESWEDNFDDYQTSQDDGFDAYHDQPVEADARETGGGYLDDLDLDDLKRIREESR